MKYTKGKWYLQKYTDAYTNIIRCDDGKGFETIYIGSTGQSGGDSRDNAKLMSKAPEMYEALKMLYNKCDNLPYGIDGIILSKVKNLLKEIEQ